MRTLMQALLIVLMVFSISIASEWKFVRPTGADNNGFYVDMGNVKRVSKNKVRFWYTVAKSPEDAKKDTSVKLYIEMDCLNKRYREVTSEREDRSQNYKEGGVRVTTETSICWDNISPDSFQESFYEILCRKKK
jgi:hypothetical protein